jgi:transcriptional regulator with XRE-family HTH domain
MSSLNESRTAALPVPVARMLQTFGANLGIARRRRGLTAAMMAERIGVSRDTWTRIERGDPGVSLGSYAKAIAALGLDPDFGSLVAPHADTVGIELDLDRLPRRVRPRNPPASPPLESPSPDCD